MESYVDRGSNTASPSIINSMSELSDTNSANINKFHHRRESLDAQGIALLRLIFPEESTEVLKKIHSNRLRLVRSIENTVSTSYSIGEESSIETNASDEIDFTTGQSQIKTNAENGYITTMTHIYDMPDDFLRLPLNVAVRRYDSHSGCWHYHSIETLAQKSLKQHNQLSSRKLLSSDQYFSRALIRDPHIGLGMTLCWDREFVRIYSVTSNDGRRWMESNQIPIEETLKGPSIDAGIEPGDILIGLDGMSLIESCSPEQSLLRHAASALNFSHDPVVLHLCRIRQIKLAPGTQTPPSVISMSHHSMTQSLLDTSSFLDGSMQSDDGLPQSETTFHSTPIKSRTKFQPTHRFVQTLQHAGLLKSADELHFAGDILDDIDRRTRQWEATGSILVSSRNAASSVFVSLAGVRPGLSVRIVNAFMDHNEMAYTLWVYDVEEGKEWYAPVRYLRDFQDLRAATIPLCPSISRIPFPTESLGFFRSPTRIESNMERETKCLVLEGFVRTLCGMIYKEIPHRDMAEVAVYIQSFLGCDCFLSSVQPVGRSIYNGPSNERDETMLVRLCLKRSIRKYTYRLFQLAAMENLVTSFVRSARTRGPKISDIEALEARGSTSLKMRAMEEMKQIQAYLDKLQEMILEGCMDDFTSIAERKDYSLIHEELQGNMRTGCWDRLVREAVREQVEIEVYVPLRSVVSRWLVNGWKHDDIEIQFKIQELRKRPQEFFRISNYEISQSKWSSASAILNEGVGLSTLPCVKLRAIVDAAREITRLFVAEQAAKIPTHNGRHAPAPLGADDFLPIFIYCMVQAEMERPCALSVLLGTLCDPINRIGEIGYYLASFEAAIAHFREIDFIEERQETSFLSVSLSDT